MSTVIGSRMVNGGSVKYHSTAGNGAVRNIASSVIGTLGHALVNKISSAVKGTGFKISGEGKHKNKVGRPKKAKTHKKK